MWLLLGFCRPVIGIWTYMYAVVLANQSTHYKTIGYKCKSYSNDYKIAIVHEFAVIAE